MRRIRVYLNVFKTIGYGMRSGRQADRMFRYSILCALDEIGFFDFLQSPQSYAEIMSEFGFEDNDYTRDMLDTIMNDPKNVIELNSDRYTVSVEEPVPDLEDVLARTDQWLHPLFTLGEGLAPNIIDRLRGVSISFSDSFERDDSELLSKFTTVLGDKAYTAMRAAAFSLLKAEEREWLRGKQLIDVGCGNGRETAQIWVRYGGEIQLTGVDPVRSMIDTARERFDDLVAETDPDHPPITTANRPVFEVASATQLPFEDNSFDAAFSHYVLHWTPDPRKAISEAVRVVRPGGLYFGGQVTKPIANPYFDLLIRSNPNCYGNFWEEEFRAWCAENGIEVEMATPAGLFRVKIPK